MVEMDQRRAAGRVVDARIAELGLSVAEAARKAHVSPTTLRSVIAGTRWPNTATRAAINKALGFEAGEVTRLAQSAGVDLRAVPTEALVQELCRRVKANGGRLLF
jgi:lambda repressor-like predicted transcriptional regulator